MKKSPTRRKNRSVALLATTVVLMMAGVASAGTLTWTGTADTDLFNEGNWDLDGGGVPPAGTIDPAVAVNHDIVIGMGTPTVDDAGFAFPLDVGQGGAGSLTITGGFLDMVGGSGANGVRAEGPTPAVPPSPLTMSGTAGADLQFVLDLNLTLSDQADLTFAGGGNPVNRSTVDLISENVTVNFLAEDVAAFTAEHLAKFTVNGEPAVLGTNLSVVSDGGTGSIVTMIPPPPALSLRVNSVSGDMAIFNDTGSPIEFDFYKITSASGSLETADWNSLQDQDLAGFPAGDGSGNGWEEAGGSNATELGEAYLQATSTMADADSVSLGSVFDEVSGTEDVGFRFRDVASGFFFDGAVEYVTTGPTRLLGDANLDDLVTGADLISVQQNFGSIGDPQTLLGDANIDGLVTGADLISVQQNFGAVAPSSGSAAASAVPEPTTFMLLGLGLLTLVGRRRK